MRFFLLFLHTKWTRQNLCKMTKCVNIGIMYDVILDSLFYLRKEDFSDHSTVDLKEIIQIYKSGKKDRDSATL